MKEVIDDKKDFFYIDSINAHYSITSIRSG